MSKQEDVQFIADEFMNHITGLKDIIERSPNKNTSWAAIKTLIRLEKLELSKVGILK